MMMDVSFKFFLGSSLPVSPKSHSCHPVVHLFLYPVQVLLLLMYMLSIECQRDLSAIDKESR